MEFVLNFRSHQMKNNDENLKTVVMQRVDDMDKTLSSTLFTFSIKMYTPTFQIATTLKVYCIKVGRRSSYTKGKSKISKMFF
jgi:hypothetical protein